MMGHLDPQSHHPDWKQLLFLHLVIQRHIPTDKHLKATGKKNHTLVRKAKEIRGNKHSNH